MAKNDVPLSLFAEAVQNKMDEMGLGTKEVSDLTESTYEHVRKILKGGAFPSKYYFSVLCDSLHLDKREMERLLTADRIRKKYGKIPLELSGKNPDLEPVERVWHKLTKQQQKDFIFQMEAVAKRNKAESRAS